VFPGLRNLGSIAPVGQQKITVEHVHVRGQAVVGVVGTRGGWGSAGSGRGGRHSSWLVSCGGSPYWRAVLTGHSATHAPDLIREARDADALACKEYEPTRWSLKETDEIINSNKQGAAYGL
jgi:hypothetical protein